MLGMAFNEDHNRIRKDNDCQNFAILRHIALNLLKHEKTSKHSIRAKRMLTCWKKEYLLKVLLASRNFQFRCVCPVPYSESTFIKSILMLQLSFTQFVNTF